MLSDAAADAIYLDRHVAQPEELRRLYAVARADLIREIEAVEETHADVRAASVLPHLTGVDLAVGHRRDRQVARHVARQLADVIALEVRKLAAAECTGRLDPEDVLALLELVAVGAPPSLAAADPGANESDVAQATTLAAELKASTDALATKTSDTKATE
jgi:hypothetical protein